MCYLLCFHSSCTGLRVPVLGIGAWSWGDRSGYWGYGKEYGQEESREAYKALIDAGLTFIDTAEVRIYIQYAYINMHFVHLLCENLLCFWLVYEKESISKSKYSAYGSVYVGVWVW